jgi:hypothetical protein
MASVDRLILACFQKDSGSREIEPTHWYNPFEAAPPFFSLQEWKLATRP